MPNLDLESADTLTFGASGNLTLDIPIEDPPNPDDVVWVKRVSPTYPAPALSALGRPDPTTWVPTETIREDWGRLRVLFNGVDVSFYRGIPVQVQSWSISTPFGYKSAEIQFPQVTPFEALPDWLVDWAEVEIQKVFPDGVTTKQLWVGDFSSEEDSLEESGSGLMAQCMGKIYHADLLLAPPLPVQRGVTKDIKNLIHDELDPNRKPYLRFLGTEGEEVGTHSGQSGSWDPLLSGFLYGQIQKAWNAIDNVPYTIIFHPTGHPQVIYYDPDPILWKMRCGTPGITHNLSRDLTMVPNVVYGEGVDEDGCHWRNTKYPQGAGKGGAYFAPLYIDTAVEPWTYDADGNVTGDNPDFDKNVMRVERYENFGKGVSKAQAIESINHELARIAPVGFAGTITLKIDPEEWLETQTSRFEMVPGETIEYKGHRGVDRIFRLIQVDVNWQDGSVTCHVDERPRDYPTLAQLLARRRDNADPASRPQKTYRNARTALDDKVEWDCENDAGIIPATELTVGEWTVLMVPAGEYGTVVKADFTVSTPARFSVGVFDREIDPWLLAAIAVSPLDSGYWDAFDSGALPGEQGLIIAWGGEGNAAGFWPALESDEGSALTGRMVDTASWYYESQHPPYLWVAMWVESGSGGVNTIEGRMYPGVT
jgi:hypothetical protein